MRAILLASATATTLNGRRARSCVPWVFFGVLASTPQDSMRTNDQDATQVAIALFGDRPELPSAAGRILSRHKPDPGCKIASRPECVRVRSRGDDGARAQDPDPRDGRKPLARFARSVLRNNPLLDGPDQRLQRLKLRRQDDQARSRMDRQAS